MKNSTTILLTWLALIALPVALPALTLDEAFGILKTYDAGQTNAALNVIEQAAGRASADTTQRTHMATRLTALLSDATVPPAAKLFICQQMRLVGGDAQVSLFAKLLRDPKTAEIASLALQSIPGDASAKAMIAGLDHAKGSNLIGLINALGERREPAAVKPMAKLLQNPDGQIASAAALALGRIGNANAMAALAKAKPAGVSQPAFDEARIVGAQRQAAVDAKTAAALYRSLLASKPGNNTRLAALAGLASVEGVAALPQLVEALGDKDATVAAFAVESLRRMGNPQATAALKQALPRTEGANRIVLLGTLAELGDTGALAELAPLVSAADSATHDAALREVSRLKYVASESVLARMEGMAGADSDAAALKPTPYAAGVIDARRSALAGALAAGDTLVVYLDCGVATSAQGVSGVGLRQLNAAGWLFAGSDRTAPAPAGTVAYDGSEVRFEIAGLDPAKRYAVGFTWWDFDAQSRRQSVILSGGQPTQTRTALPDTQLPDYARAKQGPGMVTLPIDPKLIAGGKVRVEFRRSAGPNAVVGEFWVIETQPGSPAAAGPVMTGETAAKAKPTAPADLTPPAEGTRVLIVTGIDYPAHKWMETAPVIKDLLEKDARLKVRIVEDPNALASAKLKEWDVVVLHFQNWEQPGPGAAARENLKQFVENGGGLVSVHFACGAWHGEWPEFQNIFGRVWHGSGPGKSQHDAYGKFLVGIVDKNHPITQGLADFETTDELYTCLTGDAPIHLLAQAESKVDKKDHPQAFVREYGKGRVFLTTLGHDVRAYTNNATVGELLRRGSAWAAGAPAQAAK